MAYPFEDKWKSGLNHCLETDVIKLARHKEYKNKKYICTKKKKKQKQTNKQSMTEKLSSNELLIHKYNQSKYSVNVSRQSIGLILGRVGLGLLWPKTRLDRK